MGFFGAVGDFIGGIGNNAVKLGTAGVNGVLNTTTNLVSAPITLFSGDTSGAAQNLKDAGSNVATMFKEGGAAVGGIWNSATAPVTATFNGIQSAGHSIDGFFSSKSTPAQAQPQVQLQAQPQVQPQRQVVQTPSTLLVMPGTTPVPVGVPMSITTINSGYAMPNFGGSSELEMAAFAGRWQELTNLRDYFLARAMASLNGGNQQVVANGMPQNQAANATGAPKKSVPVIVEDSGKTGETKGGDKGEMSKERTALLDKIKAQDAELDEKEQKIGELKDKIAKAKGEEAQASSVDRDLVTQNMIKELKDKVSELSAKVDGTAKKADEDVDVNQLIKKVSEQLVEIQAKDAEIKKLEEELKGLQPKGEAETPDKDQIDAAVEKKISLHNLKEYEDIDKAHKSQIQIYGDDVKTDAGKKAAYMEYAKKLLSKYYDNDNNDEVTVEEFTQKELVNNETVAELMAKKLSTPLSDKDKVIAERTASLFAQNLDFNGNGKIDAEELAFFNKEADKIDGTQDGVIKASSEAAMYKSVVGQDANDEKLKTVVEKYLQGETLTAEEKQILENGQKTLKSNIKQAADAWYVN